MEDDKSITKKLTEVISKAADTVKHAVSHAVESVSDAAQHAMEANAEKISRIPPARPDPRLVAGTTNEQVYIPEASAAAAMPAPLVPVVATPNRQKAAKPAAKAAKKTTPARKPAATPALKAAKKSAARKTGKAAKKSAVRSSNKATRKSGK